MGDILKMLMSGSGVVIGALVLILFGLFIMVAKWYKKTIKGEVLIRTGWGGTKISFSGLLKIPILHNMETMDVSVKKVELERINVDGLICKDNIRADIKVVFFVRVNNTEADVLNVAETVGATRASDVAALRNFFDAKFSEALKTIGKKFDFIELYTERNQFKEEVKAAINEDLNGYILDDAAIDYLEQTGLEYLNESNILDAEGIKKITELTATQKINANHIAREKEKTIKQQDVEAQEAILQLDKQQAEAEEKQKREILNIKSREEAETTKVGEEERLKSEKARIASDEEIEVTEQNKQRQVIIAEQSKLRTEAVEKEKVEKDRELEVIEKERVLELTRIEKEKMIEEERKNIQDVIRERVIVEKAVVVEQEKIKDTEAFALAEREKRVTVVNAEKEAEEHLLRTVKNAEADKDSASLKADQLVIEAEASQKAAELKADEMKILAEGKAAEDAAHGVSEAHVMEAKADAQKKFGFSEAEVMENQMLSEARGLEAKALATQKQGEADANVLEGKMVAEARGLEAKAMAKEKEGLVDAKVLEENMNAEAKGIENKAEAMKKLDGVGKEHEEFKLRLNKDTEIELAGINIQKDIAAAQATVLKEGLTNAKIELIGGDVQFFDKLMGAVTQGKTVDKLVGNSEVLTDVKETFFNGDGEYFKEQLKGFVDKFGMSSESLKNLSISALIHQMMGQAGNDADKGMLNQIMGMVKKSGLSDLPATLLGK
jgi:uncharacterized membrane protein YqiK